MYIRQASCHLERRKWANIIIHFSLWEPFINTCWTITRWQGSDYCLLAPVMLVCWRSELRGFRSNIDRFSRFSRPQPFGHLYLRILLKWFITPIKDVSKTNPEKSFLWWPSRDLKFDKNSYCSKKIL